MRIFKDRIDVIDVLNNQNTSYLTTAKRSLAKKNYVLNCGYIDTSAGKIVGGTSSVNGREKGHVLIWDINNPEIFDSIKGISYPITAIYSDFEKGLIFGLHSNGSTIIYDSIKSKILKEYSFGKEGIEISKKLPPPKDRAIYWMVDTVYYINLIDYRRYILTENAKKTIRAGEGYQAVLGNSQEIIYFFSESASNKKHVIRDHNNKHLNIFDSPYPDIVTALVKEEDDTISWAYINYKNGKTAIMTDINNVSQQCKSYLPDASLCLAENKIIVVPFGRTVTKVIPSTEEPILEKLIFE